MTSIATALAVPRRSAFSGVPVHELLGLQLATHAPRPVFDEDIWDLTGVVGAPIQFNRSSLLWDFTSVPQQKWRVLVREFLVAVSAPHHDAVRHLPWARRLPLSLRTCVSMRFATVQWLRWLTDNGVDALTEVTQEHCDRYLAAKRRTCTTPDSLRAAVGVLKDLARYTGLFSTDHYLPGFMPWPTSSASAVTGAKSRGENTTPPVAEELLQPALHSALYLVTTLGPHVVQPAEQLAVRRAAIYGYRNATSTELSGLLDRYRAANRPLPQLSEHDVARRLAAGWDPADPLLRLTVGELSRDLGTARVHLHLFRPQLEAAVAQLGIAPPWAHDAVLVPRADGDGEAPWTPPLTTSGVDEVVLAVFNAALFLTAQITGMRSSEMMELTSASCLPPQQLGNGLVRFKLSSKVIKGQEWGGVRDEWVVIEPVYRAVELAIRLARTMPRLTAKTAGPDITVFGRYLLQIRFDALRDWINGLSGRRLGLPVLPAGHLVQRMTRRTLALEMAHRPHGLWATKVHLKQIEVATTEGYAARPGGAQGRLHAEMKQGNTPATSA